MTDPSAELYLDLLKKTLSYSLWPEPPKPIQRYSVLRPRLRQTLLSAAAKVLDQWDLHLARNAIPTPEQRAEGRDWPLLGDTMIGMKRLNSLQACVETVLQEGVPGDLVETGVWRGGASIFMRGILKAYGITDRTVFVADSFEGLPEPDDRYPEDAGSYFHTQDFLVVSREEVENNFRRYDLLDDQVHFLEGWFEDTLPRAPIDRLAILRLDGDMYSSTMDALTSLYPKLSSGGFCIIDDYEISNCSRAVKDYRSANSIDASITEIDWTGIYWRKP